MAWLEEASPGIRCDYSSLSFLYNRHVTTAVIMETLTESVSQISFSELCKDVLLSCKLEKDLSSHNRIDHLLYLKYPGLNVFSVHWPRIEQSLPAPGCYHGLVHILSTWIDNLIK